MLPSFLLSLREGLEAALIIGILVGALRRINRSELIKVVWAGALGAVGLSLLTAWLLNRLGASLEGRAEAIFEGITMLLAAGVLTWMIFWMRSQSRTIKGELESGVRRAASQSSWGPIFLLAFIAVAREGIELALFLTAAALATGSQLTLTGAILGICTSILLGWTLFASTVRLDLRRFFQLTGFLLILFAAGLFAHGVHEFVEAGWVPAIVDHVWDINHVIDEKSTLGQMLTALFGYNGNPSLLEMIAYMTYFVVIFFGLRWFYAPSMPTAQEVRSD